MEAGQGQEGLVTDVPLGVCSGSVGDKVSPNYSVALEIQS